MNAHDDFLRERRRKRLRALAVVALLVFVAAVWRLTSGGESTEDEADPPSYEQIGAWRGHDDRGFGYTALFARPDGCVLGFARNGIQTLGPREGLECATPYEEDLDDIEAATVFGDGFAAVQVAAHKDDKSIVTVLTGTPGNWARHPLTTAGTAETIAWDGTDLVVLGTDGEGPLAWRSPDGGEWREQRLPGGGTGLTDFELAADGRGTAIAVATTEDDPGTSRLWRSDGGDWTEETTLTGTFGDLAHDGSAFHLAGSSLDAAGRRSVLVASSVDGREWTVDPGFWRASGASVVTPLPDGSLLVFTDGVEGDEGRCEDVVHRRTGETWTGERFGCEPRVESAVGLPDGRVVAADHRRVYVREPV